MGMPKKKKTNIQIYQEKQLLARRQELLDDITKNDSYLPDSILHDDLDAGMLEYVKTQFVVITDGERIPVLDKILTIQKWSEFMSTWSFANDDHNIQIPFIAVVRKPDVQPGTNPSVQRTIPDRDLFHYATVATWNGNQMGADVYRIPQPVPVDISYEVVIVCHKFRDLNLFNKIVLQRFSSRQDYTMVKGHYIPIVLDRINDNSPIESLENRRFYIQQYDFTILGFLIDSEEFDIKPAINRLLVLTEFVGSNRPDRMTFNKTIDTVTTKFIADGVKTSFNVGQPMSFLFYVSVNGIVQQQGVDYFFVFNTSKISFATPPANREVVLVSYYTNKNTTFVDSFGTPLFIDIENYVYDGSSLTFTVPSEISSIIYLNINGLIDEQGDGYEFVDKTVILLAPPVLGANIGICYIHY